MFFFNDTATTEIYTLSLHDALPISKSRSAVTVSRTRPPAITDCTSEIGARARAPTWTPQPTIATAIPDRKSTRLNSSHANISYAVFCLKQNWVAGRPVRLTSEEHTS